MWFNYGCCIVKDEIKGNRGSVASEWSCWCFGRRQESWTVWKEKPLINSAENTQKCLKLNFFFMFTEVRIQDMLHIFAMIKLFILYDPSHPSFPPFQAQRLCCNLLRRYWSVVLQAHSRCFKARSTSLIRGGDAIKKKKMKSWGKVKHQPHSAPLLSLTVEFQTLLFVI